MLNNERCRALAPPNLSSDHEKKAPKEGTDASEEGREEGGEKGD